MSAMSPRLPTRLASAAAVPGYPENGNFSWRGELDQLFIDTANHYNYVKNLQPGDDQYKPPQFLKAWAMVESGGDKAAFLSDPFQVNSNPKDWVREKATRAGLTGPDQQMTPVISAGAALAWLDYKGFIDRKGIETRMYSGDWVALRNYNGFGDVHANPNTYRVPYDYHPGIPHRNWYAGKILSLTNQMLAQ